MTKDTRDEAYHWSAQRKEKQMTKTLHAMKYGQQKSLGEFKVTK